MGSCSSRDYLSDKGCVWTLTLRYQHRAQSPYQYIHVMTTSDSALQTVDQHVEKRGAEGRCKVLRTW